METKNNNILFWIAYFMAFPGVLLLTQNISFFLVIIFVLNLFRGSTKFRLDNKVGRLTAFIALGAILSVVFVKIQTDQSLSRALIVLPNYIYWCGLIFIFSSYLHKVNMYIIYKGITYGLITTIVYYHVLQSFLKAIPVFRGLPPNGYAFLLICFAPVAIYQLYYNGKKPAAIILILVMLASLLSEGRRAGLVIVAAESFVILLFLEISARNIAISLFSAVCLYLVINTPFVRGSLRNYNERVYTAIFESEDVRTTDQSYLTRLAMVNKGLQIFKEYPLTGIGLNNFSEYDIDINLDFEGGELLQNKKLDNKSAHNSYITIIAEGGLMLFVPFVLLLATIIFYFIRNYNKIDNFKKPIFLGIVGMCMHLYVISAIVNVFAWFLIAIAGAFILNRKFYYWPTKAKKLLRF